MHVFALRKVRGMSGTLKAMGHVGDMKKYEKLKKIVAALQNGITITGSETELAWAVIRLGIMEIGWYEREEIPTHKGSDEKEWYYDRSKDSTWDIENGGLDFWFNVVGLDKSYVRRVFDHFNILKGF